MTIRGYQPKPPKIPAATWSSSPKESTIAKKKKAIFEEVVATASACFDGL
jgi:hypothetical protein